MNTELTTLQGTAVSSTIEDKELSRITGKFEKLAKAQVKSGWEWAYNAAQVKDLFGDKGKNPKRDSIAAQFPTIKEYADKIGLSTASIHNPAKGLKFMEREHLVPAKLTKDGKTQVDFDRFTLNVGQAIELAAVPADDWEEFKAQAEQAGLVFSTMATKAIRAIVANYKEGVPLLTTSEDSEDGEDSKDSKSGKATKDSKDSKNKLNVKDKETALAAIVKLMDEYGVSINDIKKASKEARA